MKRMKEDVEQLKRLPARCDLCWQPHVLSTAEVLEGRTDLKHKGRVEKQNLLAGPHELTESKYSEMEDVRR